MKAVSGERKKLLDKERGQLAGKGLFIDMKKRTKIILRLAPIPEGEMIARLVGEHFISGSPFVCPEVTFQEECSACKAHRSIAKVKGKQAKKLADALKPRRRYWMKVVDRANPVKVGIFPSPSTVYEKIFDVFDIDEEDISDPNEGRDFRVSKKGTGFDTEYDVRILEESLLIEDESAQKELERQAETLDFDSYLSVDVDALDEAVSTLVDGVIDADGNVVGDVPDQEPEEPGQELEEPIEPEEPPVRGRTRQQEPEEPVEPEEPAPRGTRSRVVYEEPEEPVEPEEPPVRGRTRQPEPEEPEPEAPLIRGRARQQEPVVRGRVRQPEPEPEEPEEPVNIVRKPTTVAGGKPPLSAREKLNMMNAGGVKKPVFKAPHRR